MTNFELKHTITVDRDAWFMRFYAWLWEGDLKQVTFCKLFWAYVFALPGLVLRGLVVVVTVLIHPLVVRAEARRTARRATLVSEAPQPPPAKKTPSTMQRILARIEHGTARVVFALSTVWDFVSRHQELNRVLLRLLVAVGILVSAGGAGTIAYLAVTNFSTTGIVLIGLAAFIALVLFAAAIVAFGIAEFVYLRLITPFGHGAKGGALGFVGVMRIGYRAVKTNTCPRIEVKDDELS